MATDPELLRQVGEICGPHRYSKQKVLDALEATNGDVDVVVNAIFDQRLDDIVNIYSDGDLFHNDNILDNSMDDDEVVPHVASVNAKANDAIVILSSDHDDSPCDLKQKQPSVTKNPALVHDTSHVTKALSVIDDDDDELPDWTEAMSQTLPGTMQASKNDHTVSQYFGKQSDDVITSSPPAAKSRKRKTAEELNEEKERKAAERERKKLEKEAQKLEKEKERAIRDANKVAVKGQTVTEMVLEMDEGILELVEGQAVVQQVKEMGAHVLLRKNKIPLSVIWKRHITKKWDVELSAYVPLPADQQFLFEENIVVVIMRTKDIADDLTHQRLTQKIQSMKARMKGKLILLVIIEMVEYARNVRQQIQKSFKNASSFSTQPDKDEIEHALLELNLSERIHHLILGRGENLYEWFMTFSREIAVAPYDQTKQAAKMTFGVEDLGPSGKTLTDTWEKMLQMLHGITPPISSVIVSQFPSISYFLNVMNDSSARSGDFLNHLANISINRASSNTVRRLGPAISSRVMDMFTLTDADANFR